MLTTKREQAPLGIADPEAFGEVRTAVEGCFSTLRVREFLRSLERARLRIRDFELVLGKGLLGAKAKGDYMRLGDADRGQIREYYLAALEHVAPPLREKFFKLYAYY